MKTMKLNKSKVNNADALGVTTNKIPSSKGHQVQRTVSIETDYLQNLDKSKSKSLGQNRIMKAFHVALCDHTEKVLSDRPEGISSKLYPYEILDEGMVKLHDIFKPIFLIDEDLILPKEDADLVCGTYLGYNKKTDVGVLIVRDANGEPEQIVACPAQGQAYIVDFLTGEKFMTIENTDDKEN